MDNDTKPSYRTIRGYELAKMGKRELTPTMEDYLEMAYKQCMQNGHTRTGLIAAGLHVRPSSATKMLAKLDALGYLCCDRYGMVMLTEKGRQTGVYLLYRHETVENFLRLIGSPKPLQEAELIEHYLSQQTIDHLHRHLQTLSPKNDTGA